MLGGNDVDSCLVTGIQTLYNQWKHHDLIGKTNEKKRKRKIQRLRSICEDLKRTLSSESSVIADLSEVADGTNGDDTDLPISRNTFEYIIQQIFDKCMATVDKVTEKEGWAPGAIRHVILVGGSSRIAAFRQLLQNKFKKARIPSVDVVNPYSCVAEGACRKMINDVNHVANALIPLETSYGISGGDQVMILLRKGMHTPCDSANIFVKVVDTSSKKLVTTIYEYNGSIDTNQANLLIPINQCFRKETIEFDISKTESNIFELHMHLEHGGSMRITCLDYYDRILVDEIDLTV